MKLRHWHRRYRAIGYRDRTMLLSLGPFVINALIGAGKLTAGLVYASPWFISTAVYYLLLCGARGQLLWRFRATRLLEDPAARFGRQFAAFRRVGAFICLLGVSYLGVCLCLYVRGEGITYPFYLAYGAAAVAFYKIGMSVYGLAVSRRMKNPILTAMKRVAFIDACVSLVAVQCALLTEQSTVETATRSSAVLGAAFGVVFIGMGIAMVLKKKTAPAPDEWDLPDKTRAPRSS